MSEYQYLKVEKADGVARITFNRPKHNVLDIQMMNELITELKGLAADEELKCVVLNGEGASFCAGVEVSDHKPEMAAEMIDTFNRIFEMIGQIEVRVTESLRADLGLIRLEAEHTQRVGLSARTTDGNEAVLLEAHDIIPATGALHLQIQISLWLSELYAIRNDRATAQAYLHAAEQLLTGSDRRALQAIADRIAAQLN